MADNKKGKGLFGRLFGKKEPVKGEGNIVGQPTFQSDIISKSDIMSDFKQSLVKVREKGNSYFTEIVDSNENLTNLILSPTVKGVYAKALESLTEANLVMINNDIKNGSLNVTPERVEEIKQDVTKLIQDELSENEGSELVGIKREIFSKFFSNGVDNIQNEDVVRNFELIKSYKLDIQTLNDTLTGHLEVDPLYNQYVQFHKEGLEESVKSESNVIIQEPETIDQEPQVVVENDAVVEEPAEEPYYARFADIKPQLKEESVDEDSFVNFADLIDASQQEQKETYSTFQLLSSFRRTLIEVKEKEGTLFVETEDGKTMRNDKIDSKFIETMTALREHETYEVNQELASGELEVTPEKAEGIRQVVNKLKQGDAVLTPKVEEGQQQEDVEEVAREVAEAMSVLAEEFFPGNVAEMKDEDIVRNFEVMNRHRENVATVNSLLNDNLQKDSPQLYEQYVQSQQEEVVEDESNEESETGETPEEEQDVNEQTVVENLGISELDPDTTQKEGLVSRLASKIEKAPLKDDTREQKPEKTPKKPKKTKNKMLNIINGLEPIPNEYYASAVDMWVKLFKEEPSKVLETLNEATPAPVVDEVPVVEETAEAVEETIVDENAPRQDEESLERSEESVIDDVPPELAGVESADAELDAQIEAEQEDNVPAPEEITVQNTEPPKQPTGITDLAVDALWQDIYKTVGGLKKDDGSYKIGNTTAELLQIASNNASPETLSKDQQKRAKDILTKTYKNHAETILNLPENDPRKIAFAEEIKRTLGKDLREFYIDNNEQAAADIAEAKYHKHEESGLTPRGWARLALFELSQAKYNTIDGSVNNRMESPFYRELRNAGKEFSIDAYIPIIEDSINAQLEDIDLTSPDAPQKQEATIIGKDGKEVEVIVTEVNGVNCYIAKPLSNPPIVYETDTITPDLVRVNDVVDMVGMENSKIVSKEASSQEISTYATNLSQEVNSFDHNNARGDAGQKGVITKDTGSRSL